MCGRGQGSEGRAGVRVYAWPGRGWHAGIKGHNHLPWSILFCLLLLSTHPFSHPLVRLSISQPSFPLSYTHPPIIHHPTIHPLLSHPSIPTPTCVHCPSVHPSLIPTPTQPSFPPFNPDWQSAAACPQVPECSPLIPRHRPPAASMTELLPLPKAFPSLAQSPEPHKAPLSLSRSE